MKELALMLVVAVLVTDAVAVFEPLSVTLVVVEEVPVGRADVDSVTLELVVALRVAVPVSVGGGELAAAVGVCVEVEVLEEVPLVLHVVEATCVVLMVLDPVTELVSEILGRVIGTTVLPKGSGELDHVAVTLLLHDALTVTLKLLDTLLVAVEEPDSVVLALVSDVFSVAAVQFAMEVLFGGDIGATSGHFVQFTTSPPGL